ncbi:hypothetical protein ASF75_00785 [Curtobacterium sp. Leaf154]|nr:hypothetical protein ASF75_00785 [Curtobacterium sp. Leaf154]
MVGLHGGGPGDPSPGRQHGTGCVTVQVGHEPDRRAEPVEPVGTHERGGDGAVPRHEVAGQHCLDLDAPGVRSGDEGTQSLRGPSGIPHGDRHREQRGQRPGDEDQPGDAPHGPAAASRAERDAAHTGHEHGDPGDHRGDVGRSDEQGGQDPHDGDGRRDPQVDRARCELHARLRPARGRAARRTARHRSR